MPGPYFAVGVTTDGRLIVSRFGEIGIFDGLHWQRIALPNIIARGLLQKGTRLWIGSGGELGWVDLTVSEPTYHVALRGFPNEVSRIFDAGHNFIALSGDAVLLLKPNGDLISRISISYQPIRWTFRWKDGWVAVSLRDMLYITAKNTLSVTPETELNIPNEYINCSVTTPSGIFLSGPFSIFQWTNEHPKLVAKTKPGDVCRHLVSTECDPEQSTVIRIAGEGLDGFSTDMEQHYWQMPVGREIDGNIATYPTATPIGLFLATNSKLYWIPSPTQLRKLTSTHQATLGISTDETGYWICTSDGSWHVANNSWVATEAFPLATYSVKRTTAGLIRGQLPTANVNAKREINTGSGGQVKAICNINDGFVLIQSGTISRWSNDLKIINQTNVHDFCTSGVTLTDKTILIGSQHDGPSIWSIDGSIHNIENRGNLLCCVAAMGGVPIILWSDGLLEIGKERISIPTTAGVRWIAVAARKDRIVIGGTWGNASALMSVERKQQSWTVTPLDHPALNILREIEYIGLLEDRVAIAGAGGCFDIALSAFDRDISPPPSSIWLLRARTNGARSFLRYTGNPRSSDIELHEHENELEFALKGGPEYWKQRVQFAYRLLPDSADWTDIDPAREIDIQRIAAGNHTLEIESRSLMGTATSRYTIIRPPYWYASHWAFGAYGLSLMGATAGFFVWRTRRLRVRARVLEERVAQRTAELKKANEAKDEFLASMSHEIRNPLNGVIGLSGMLQESVQTERDRRLIESLRACADQLRLVLDDVLDFSVIERGDVQLQLAPFNPAAAIRAAVVAVDAKLERTHVTFGPKLADGLWLRGDEGKLRQIVSNLVSNAHKYGVPPEAKVDARLHDGRLIVTVSNTGPDIPQDDQARIFESFERGRSAAHKYVRGAGLGLTISSRFVRAMGGEITVKSENGLTSFAASIPAPVVEKPAHTMAVSAVPSRGVALAIEDEPYNRLVLGHVLSGLGFEVEWAQNGTDALDILKSGRPYAMIFTDWMLPDMQGSELVRQIKQLRGEATPPMVAVTAYATAEKRAEAFDAGVAAFVTKPITPEKIEDAVQANAAADAPSPPVGRDEPLRVGILLDGNDAAERVASFRTELLQHMAEIETALRQHDSDRTARWAHRLASQLLAIHHHTFADELRALETAALRYQWDLVRDLYANATRAATSLSRQLETLAHSHGAKPASDRP